VPVGAALAARDSIVRTVRPWTDLERARRELRKLERRGRTALRRNQRRVERQARSRRRKVERGVDGFQADAENVVEQVQKRVKSIA
jgi:t-SNARE complex subunit (syntaxin)